MKLSVPINRKVTSQSLRNLRCVHCHASSGKPNPDEMTTEEAKRFASAARRGQ